MPSSNLKYYTLTPLLMKREREREREREKERRQNAFIIGIQGSHRFEFRFIEDKRHMMIIRSI